MYLMERSRENKKSPIHEEKPPRRHHIIVPIIFTTSTYTMVSVKRGAPIEVMELNNSIEL